MRESDYYIWLRDLSGNRRRHTKLIKHLDSIQYRWIFDMDKNRAAGGENLRYVYADAISVNDEDVRTGPCTVLEMMLSVAGHMVDQLGEDIAMWFWVLVVNLGLDKYDDYNYDPDEVLEKIDIWLNHDYDGHGVGSIFPLKHYPGDCRNLDVWSMMNAWINENYPSDNGWLN